MGHRVPGSKHDSPVVAPGAVFSREDGDKWRAVLANAPQIAIVLDPAAAIIFANRGFLELTGWGADEVLGRDWFNLCIPAELHETMRMVFLEAMCGHSTGAHANYENEIVTRNGDRRNVIWSNVVTADASGDVLDITCLGVDITERTRVEAELRRTTQLIDAVREAQSLYIAQGDPQPVFDRLLQTLVGMTGSEFGFLDEVLLDPDGTPYKLSLAMSDISWDAESSALYGELRARNLEFRNLGNLSGLPALLDEPVIANDAPHDARSGGLPAGHPPIRSFMGLPVRADGRTIGVIGIANRPGGYDEELARFLEPYLNACAGIILSIRLRRRECDAMAALASAEQNYRSLVHYSHGLVAVISRDGNFTFASSSWQQLLGYDPAEVVKLDFSQIIHPDDVERCRDMIQATVTRGEVEPAIEVRVARRDGSWRWHRGFVTPVIGGDGDIGSVLVHSEDVTERRLVEDTRAFLLDCGLSTGGEDFFASLARYLAGALGMGYVCIDRLDGDRLAAHTLAVYNDGRFESNVTYALKDTPCGEVVDKRICCYPRGVRELFPQDAALQELEAESYFGVTLFGSRGEPIGLIAVIGRQPLSDRDLPAVLLDLVAARAASELERREAAAAAEAGHMRLLSILDAVCDPVYVADPRTHELLYVNKALTDTIGQPGTRRCYEYLQHRDRPCPYCNNDQLFGERLGESLLTEVRNEANGRWYRCFDRAITWPDGRLVRYEMAIDITDRKVAEEALTRKYRHEVTAGRCAVVLGGPENLAARLDTLVGELQRFTGVSRAYIFRNEVDPSLGMCCTQVHEKVADGITAEIDNPLLQRLPYSSHAPSLLPTLQAGQPFARVVSGMTETEEREILVAQGVLSVLILPILADGGFWGFIGFDDCVDERHWHADDVALLAEIAASIGNAVSRQHAAEERERLQSQLAQAQKMESVGRLAGGVAHDFNNMLGVIIGHADLAKECMANGEGMGAHIQEIRRAAERSASLTRQLLAFARKQAAAPQVLDLNDTVEGMLKMLRRLIGEDIDLAWLPGKIAWRIFVDPSHIDQILANLCVNARDAISDSGRITIETRMAHIGVDACRMNPGMKPGDFVELIVADNGMGMDQATQASIFEPFFTTKEVGQGTGLGLATVYGIVKQNSGFISVQSEPGRGSTFRIYLPRHVGGDETDRKPAADFGAVGGDETILVVEDEPSILEMAAMMLEHMGYRVLAANSPAEGECLAAAHTGPIDLLVTDVIMPGTNGSVLAHRLAEARPGIKCLFMSGYTANVIARQGVLEPGVNFIQKPFTMADLGTRVRGILDRD